MPLKELSLHRHAGLPQRSGFPAGDNGLLVLLTGLQQLPEHLHDTLLVHGKWSSFADQTKKERKLVNRSGAVW